MYLIINIDNKLKSEYENSLLKQPFKQFRQITLNEVKAINT